MGAARLGPADVLVEVWRTAKGNVRVSIAHAAPLRKVFGMEKNVAVKETLVQQSARNWGSKNIRTAKGNANASAKKTWITTMARQVIRRVLLLSMAMSASGSKHPRNLTIIEILILITRATKIIVDLRSIPAETQRPEHMLAVDVPSVKPEPSTLDYSPAVTIVAVPAVVAQTRFQLLGIESLQMRRRK